MTYMLPYKVRPASAHIAGCRCGEIMQEVEPTEKERADFSTETLKAFVCTACHARLVAQIDMHDSPQAIAAPTRCLRCNGIMNPDPYIFHWNPHAVLCKCGPIVESRSHQP